MRNMPKTSVGDVRVDEAAVEAKRTNIRDAMRRLGDRIASGDDSELLYWVIDGALACAHRPLRYHPRYAGSRVRLPAEALALVDEWAVRLGAAGIRSILSLMHDGDLACYGGLDLQADDLIGYFSSQGFAVAHHPYEDPAHKRSTPAERRATLLKIRPQALASFDELPKPVLIQCSAGQDRSAPVAAFIAVLRGK
jgi:hypothetical protein